MTPGTPRSPLLPAPAPRAAFRRRVASLRKALARHDLGFVLITNPLDVGYLTGFMGGDSYLLVGPARNVLITDFRYEEEAREVGPLASVHVRRGGMAAAVGEVLGAHRTRRVGIQSEYVTLAERAGLARAAGRSVRLVAVAGLVQPLRAIKDAHEVAIIRSAIRIQEAALLATLPTIRAGQSELDVASRLEAEMKSRGSSAPAFETIVAAGAMSSRPHYRPGSNRLRHARPLLIDWGATWRGYRGDMTRTFMLGRWPARLRAVYDLVREAHLAAAAGLRAGASTRDVDARARDLIARAGYGKAFGHGLGHGIGLNIHEDPRLAHNQPERRLEAGMVVTIEPGVYLPGLGGVRLENDYLVTPNGAECLCSLPMDLDWATL